MDEYLLKIIDEGYEILSWALLIEEQPRRERKLEARAVKQYSEQINDHGIYVHKNELN